jgi:hypothetical protein
VELEGGEGQSEGEQAGNIVLIQRDHADSREQVDLGAVLSLGLTPHALAVEWSYCKDIGKQSWLCCSILSIILGRMGGGAERRLVCCRHLEYRQSRRPSIRYSYVVLSRWCSQGSLHQRAAMPIYQL